MRCAIRVTNARRNSVVLVNAKFYDQCKHRSQIIPEYVMRYAIRVTNPSAVNANYYDQCKHRSFRKKYEDFDETTNTVKEKR